ncbi:hypothetical protein ACHAQH_004332 [Verticillium albo-atrum]
MQVAKRVQIEDPVVLKTIRGAYVMSNLIMTTLYVRVYFSIREKKEMTRIPHAETNPEKSESKPAATVNSYDLKQLRAAFRSQLLVILVASFIHFYLGFQQPMMTQAIIPLKGAFENKLVQIHVFGQSATGHLSRPFEAAGGLFSIFKRETSKKGKGDAKSIQVSE